MTVLEEKAMYSNGIVMSIWNIIDIYPDWFPRFGCTGAVVVGVVRHDCLWQLMLAIVVGHSPSW